MVRRHNHDSVVSQAIRLKVGKKNLEFLLRKGDVVILCRDLLPDLGCIGQPGGHDDVGRAGQLFFPGEQFRISSRCFDGEIGRAYSLLGKQEGFMCRGKRDHAEKRLP